MSNGYLGKILRVDLSGRKTWVEEPDELFYRRYCGGWNFIAHYLLKETRPGLDPLGPENVLVFATGILTGAPLSGSARNSIGAKSPLSGSFGETDVGGFFGAELKRAGWDAIVVQGQADKPVYLWINDDKVEIRDAGHLWGLNTREALEQIRSELGDRLIRAAQIGPGGENLVRYAAVINDLKHAGGRTGMGAVMGAKRLKAVAVRGHQAVPLANAEKVREMAHWFSENVDKLASGSKTWGTGAMMKAHILTGNIPTNNFGGAQFPDAEMISAQEIARLYRTGMEGCYACSVRCKKMVSLKEPYAVDVAYGGPEYETLGAFGSACGVNDLAAICKAHELSQAYSLDTISAGMVIAFAMECFENGLLTTKDTDGIELRFGNAAGMVQMVEKIARREGIGDLLAEGSLRAAQKIGGGAERFAMQVKGEEIPMHEPRFKISLALGYAVSPTGADHCHNVHDAGYEKAGSALQALNKLGILEPSPMGVLDPAKVRLYAYSMPWKVLADCLDYCTFVPWTNEQLVELTEAFTGWQTSLFELAKVGERGITMARAYNVREGFTAQDDWLPERFFQGQPSGPLKEAGIKKEDLAQAKRLYYGMMGWDPETGIPSEGKLAELDVHWVAEALKVAARG